MDFKLIKDAVAAQFAKMVKEDGNLFVVDVERDTIWESYLGSFPEGTNPIYRVRREYDCSICRQFVRVLGGVVSINPQTLKVSSIWDITVSEPAFQTVADAMSNLIHSKPIVNSFRHSEHRIGADFTMALFEDKTTPVKFDHFFANLPVFAFVHGKDYGTVLSQYRSGYDVFKRGCVELTSEAFDTVLELIAQNSLYRGEEFMGVITAFYNLKKKHDALPEDQREAFLWLSAVTQPASVLRFRSMAIGQLIIDLSDDVELEAAVSSYERITAPTNYRRPTSLVSKAMVERAKQTIAELGLESALARRCATIDDIPVVDAIFVDRNQATKLEDDPFDVPTTGSKKQDFKQVQEITIDKFIAEVVPTATKLEVLLENKLTKNLVTMTTAADPTAPGMFKWNNPLAWAYTGDVTDSIKERVKNAGGNITADLCCRLSWDNTDDLDLHMIEPSGFEVFFRQKMSPSGMQLDIDMNAGHTPLSTEPVENIFMPSEHNLSQNGVYRLFVHNFNRRNGNSRGFTVEIDFKGEVKTFNCDKVIPTNHVVEVAMFKYVPGEGIVIVNSLPEIAASRQVWGLTTNNFVPVKALVKSPNHWGGNNIGNQHYFFMLDGCVNPDSVRGFYNEFLRDDLTQHRKVFELVGTKAKAESTPNQLSGVGFSTTQPAQLLVRVTGKFTRVLRVTF